MPDIDCAWGGDFGLTPSGDLALAEGIALDNQHITRRLLTALRGYLWHPSYGAGLLQRIGRVALARNITALVRAQIQLEATVARLPAPAINVQFKADSAGLCSIRIDYTDAVSGLQTSIALEIPTRA